MPKVELPFEALLEATGQLDKHQLEMLAHHLSEVRRLQKKQGFQVEAQQVKERYENLSLSQADWERYNALVEKRRLGQMNAKDDQEWRELVVRNEDLGVARVTLLSDFGRRHGLSLSEVIRRLKVKARDAAIV